MKPFVFSFKLKMVVKDDVLSDISVIIGISLSQNNRSQIKYFSFLTMFLYCISMIHFMAAYSYCAIQENFLKGASYLFLAINSQLIYYLLVIKRNKISRILLKIFDYRNQYKPVKNFSLNFVKIFIIAMFLILFVINQIANFITVSTPGASIHYWTFGTTLPQGIWKAVILIFICIMQYISFGFQISVTLVLSIIFYKFSEMLKAYNKSLQHQLHDMNKTKIMIMIDDYFSMHKIIFQLHQVLSYPTFFIVLHSSNFIFSSLFLALKTGKGLFSNYPVLLDVFDGFATGVFILIPYTICSSMITEKLFEIRKTVREKNNELASNDKLWIPHCVLQSLKRIEKDEIEYMPACGLFHVSRGFILTAIGASLTYDLLIINYL